MIAKRKGEREKKKKEGGGTTCSLSAMKRYVQTSANLYCWLAGDG